ncbi:oligosaccharide flippase family protein [Nocardioides hwasunensis]|uniref:Oligosaccharide flippase family protein n=1 Tax=Nocardioides hwasunensis TaxID=397258 RepID=A0ABR8MGY3_9ACTN|nr:oligosaccharide flippase family protein [Nocardioides hwasunensis]MBD3915233.1 oligosaccharide flippase family protein [Nocardioides hwasunensis]
MSRGLGWSLGSSVVLRVGNLLLSIVIARLVAPEAYGVFAVALTVWTVVSALSEFGLGSDVVRSRDPERRAPTVATLGAGLGLLAAAVMALAAPFVAEAFRSPGSTRVLVVMALAPALFGLTIVPAAFLQRAYRQRTLFVVNGAALLASAVTIVWLTLLDVGPVALAWGQVASQATLVLGLHVAARRPPRFGFDRATAWDSLAFSSPLAVANLVSWLLITLDNVIVSRELSPIVLGFYVLAFNVSSWPMSAVGQAVRVVALPAFSDTDSAAQRNDGLVRSIGPVVLAAAFMGLGLATLASPVVAVLYGARWAPASAALVGLAVFGATRVVLDLLATFLVAAGRTRDVLVVQLVWLAAMVPVMVLSVREWGLAGAGWAHVVVVVVVVLPAYAFFLGRSGVDTVRLVGASIVPLAAVVPAAAACWWIVSATALSPWLTVLLGGTCATALYLGPLIPWFRNRLDELRNPRPAATHRRGRHHERS